MMSEDKRLSDDEIVSKGWVNANIMMANCVKGKTGVEANNALDVLRNTFLAGLAIDLANASHQGNWDEGKREEHLSRLMGAVLEICHDFLKKIEAGNTNIHRVLPSDKTH